jgi:hypothetical protein
MDYSHDDPLVVARAIAKSLAVMYPGVCTPTGDLVGALLVALERAERERGAARHDRRDIWCGAARHNRRDI